MPRPLSSLKKDMFRKRKHTIMKKAFEIMSYCKAQVYVVVYFHGRYHVFSSGKTAHWPPSQETIVSVMPAMPAVAIF